MRNLILALFIIITLTTSARAQTESDTLSQQKEKKYQAKAPTTQPFGKEAFGPTNNTTVRWLGMAGFLINSRGTTLMVDPLLKGFDMPIMIQFPIRTADVPKLDAISITHGDNDHYSVPTNQDLKAVTKVYHSTY